MPTFRPTSFKLLNVDAALGTFSGYGAVFHNEDRTGDIIEPGAFKATLATALQTKARVGSAVMYPLLWMHNADKPVGGVTLAREDAKGLYIEGQCDLDIELGRMAFRGLQQGYANAFSIGYDTVRATRDKRGIRHLLEVKLWEVSLVTSGFAANPEALVQAGSVKSATSRDAYDQAVAKMDALMGRLPLGPVSNPTPPFESREPALPQPNEYPTDSKYREAMEEWLVKRNSVGQPTQAQRNQQTFEQACAADLAKRVQLGTATLSERLAHYRATGRTPDGRLLPDERERIRRAMDAVYARLNEAGE